MERNRTDRHGFDIEASQEDDRGDRGLTGEIAKGLDLVTISLVTAFAASGIAKLAASAPMVENFQAWGYPLWFMYVVGLTEILGAFGLALPGRRLAGASLRFWGSGVLGGLMVGAVGTHLVHAEFVKLVAPITLLGALVWNALQSGPEARPF